jgi:cystathionine beta-lyase/cystathionine gamma-synthase
VEIDDYLDPTSAPVEPPALDVMDDDTRALHVAIDANMRRAGRAYLRPEGDSLQTDLLGSERMIAWQEQKAQASFLQERCWSELPQTYSRYGTESTRELVAHVRALEKARAAVVTDSGMQAVAVLFDVLLERDSHVIVARGVYNKTKGYLSWLAKRIGCHVTLVEDGEIPSLGELVQPGTRVFFVETFTNPLMRALDPEALVTSVRRARETSPALRLVVDNTIATPWGVRRPLIEQGIDFVVGSGTKALDGRDLNMWGYIASDRVDVLNECLDLMAMRGGVLDGRRAASVVSDLAPARERHESRCQHASSIARFLAGHPKVSEVWHPSIESHPDHAVIERHYTLPGSLLSFRLQDADDEATRHFCDVLAMTGLPRYALSFDGLVTKINHHRTVSEYFTSPAEVERLGVDRLVRLGVGLEAPRDIMACLNWALWRFEEIPAERVREWQAERLRSLGVDSEL